MPASLTAKAHRYEYKSSGNVTFIFEGKVTVDVTYPAENAPKTAKLTMPPPREVEITQDLLDANATLSDMLTNISWTDSNFTMQFINHADYDSQEWWISEVLFAYNATPPIVGSTLPKGVVSQTYSKLYTSDMHQPYQCNSVHFSLYGSQPQSYATIRIEGFKLQAFEFSNNTFGADANICIEPLPDTTQIILPVVIGGVLLLLAVMSLTAYIVGCWCSRRKKPVTYQVLQ